MRPPAIALHLASALIFSLAFMQPAIALLGNLAVPTDFLFVATSLALLWALGSGRFEFAWDSARDSRSSTRR